MTRKKKCNSKSNSFVAAAEQVCLQPVLEHRQRRGRRNIAWEAIPHLCSSNRKGQLLRKSISIPARRSPSAGTSNGRVPVSVSVPSRCSIEMAERIELVFGTLASFDPSYTVVNGHSDISKKLGYWNVFLNSELRQFRHGTGDAHSVINWTVVGHLVDTTSALRRSTTVCKQSAPHCRQIVTPTPHHSFFTGRMLFLTSNQQCQRVLKAHI